MKVQRFRAASYAEALRQVKAALGEDAVILENRKIRRGAEGRPAQEEVPGRWQWRWLGRGREDEPSPAGPVIAVEITAAIGEGADALVTPLADDPRSATTEGPALPVEGEAPRRTEACARLETRLINEEVDPRLAAEIVEWVEASAGDLAGDEARVLDLAVGALIQRITLLPVSVEGAESADKPRVQVLVGPAGLGKTTTIAKLTAAGCLKTDEKLAILSLGDPNVAHEPELARVADVLQASYQVCEDTDALMEALEPLGEVDRILIDTPSVSPFDQAGLEALERHLSAVPSREVHLVLSPLMRDRDLLQAVRGYAGLKLSALLFTHLDEAASYGGILNAAVATQLPLSWLTFGTRIPGDIEAASAERLVDLVLDLSAHLDEDDVELESV